MADPDEKLADTVAAGLVIAALTAYLLLARLVVGGV